ncbi:MAG TPA: hypothetical protein DDZ88_24325 [Verrucomicrobiales bacterium]|nr:hypothetical protein [Verrucomicrobiales bacterium]
MSSAPNPPADDFPAGQTGDMRDVLLSPPTGAKPSTSPAGRWEPPTAEELQKLLPQYEITALLGRGGMGAVYKGRQIALDRPVAIKILSNTLEEADASFAERFKNEARALGKLSHPGIVGVYDFGEAANGLLYIVMEFIDGTDVARMLAQQKRLHTEHAMAITAHVCDALAYAHERGIIHRDIKPANIMVGYDGVVKVADFGLAKMTHNQNSGLTQSGMAMGTLHYMAPEALMLGSAVDHRADIYAVGVMLYQMLTGKIPQGLFELPSLQVAGLDPRYDSIIGKALREDRDLRYPSVLGMRRDLDAILTQPVVKVEPSAEKAPAALQTQARPQRPGGQPYRLPQPEVIVRTERKGSPLLWVAVIVLGGIVAWLYLNRSSSSPSHTSTDAAASAPGDAAKSVGGSRQSSQTPPTASSVSSESSHASKDAPFTNTLGMKFVPVPITGGPTDKQRVLFSVWETRVQDYEVFVKATSARWGKPIFQQGPTHPAGGMAWNEAKAFCEWLTDQERKAGKITAAEAYRLPTDHEWSCAVGIGDKEDAAKAPADKTMAAALNNIYPWGTAWPPPPGSVNLGGEELGELHESSRVKPLTGLKGYRDAFPRTAPVGSFRADGPGIFDLAGNVREWCSDLYAPGGDRRVLRGGAWLYNDPPTSQSSRRDGFPVGDNWRSDVIGFRCVLAVGTPPAQVSTAPIMPPSPQQPSGSAGAALPTAPTPSPSHTPADTQGMEPLVDVDFAKPHEGFPAATTARLVAEWKEGSYRMTALSSAIWVPSQPAIQNLTLTDFVCEVEAQIPRQAEGSWAIRLANKNHRQGDYIQDFRFEGSGKAMIPTPTNRQGNRLDTTASLAGAGWNKMRVEASNSRYRLFVNDRFVTEVPQEGRISPNGIAIPLNTPAPGLEVWIRRVRVWQPGAAVAPAPSPTGLTTWTDTKGRSITATFKALASGNVLLDIAGKVTPVPFNTLSPESQKLARAYHDQSNPVTTTDPAKAAPFVNTLGMKFVPVPGTKVLFCIHEARYKDWAAYAAAEKVNPRWKVSLNSLKGDRLEDYPIKNVTHDDAVGFCEWMTKKEGKTYRLPTDQEWSLLAGLKEKLDVSPMQQPASTGHFHWGTRPLAKDVGNFCDEAFGRKYRGSYDAKWLEIDDGYADTAPVGSYPADANGLFDFAGNVWEWVQGWYDPPKNTLRIVRGGAFRTGGEKRLLASFRGPDPYNIRLDSVGFRIICEP